MTKIRNRYRGAAEGAERVAAFVRWARRDARPFQPDPDRPGQSLAPLDEMIGDAAIVALGEAEHLLDEPLALRNLLARHLVAQRGFTAIALESGLAEGRVLHEVVLASRGDVDAACRDGLSWTFDRLARNRELVHWIQDHNCRPGRRRRIGLYGFDIPGSPSVPAARRGVGAALEEAMRFAKGLDAAAAAPLVERHARLAERLRFDLANPGHPPGYESLDPHGRDALSSLVADVTAFIAAREPDCADRAAVSSHDWALRTAIAAGQLDAWLRGLPAGYDGSARTLRFLQPNANLRDRAQADNIDWILQREGPGAKLLVFGHNNHLAMTSSHWHWSPVTGGTALQPFRRRPAGTYLRQRHGQRLVTVAHVTPDHQPGAAVPATGPETVEGLLARVGIDSFLLDLRQRPEALSTFLREPRRIGAVHHLRRHWRVALEVALEGAYDLVWFSRRSTPAATIGSGRGEG